MAASYSLEWYKSARLASLAASSGSYELRPLFRSMRHGIGGPDRITDEAFYYLFWCYHFWWNKYCQILPPVYKLPPPQKSYTLWAMDVNALDTGLIELPPQITVLFIGYTDHRCLVLLFDRLFSVCLRALDQWVHYSYVIQRHLLGHIACFGRCGLSTAYFTVVNEWMNEWLSWLSVSFWAHVKIFLTHRTASYPTTDRWRRRYKWWSCSEMLS